jgi:uncharacterized membrane protein
MKKFMFAAGYRKVEMKTHFTGLVTGLVTGLALAALLTIGSTLPGFAEDAAPPKEIMAQPPAAKTETPPPSVPRPSLAPKTAEPASAPVAEPAQRPVAEPAQRPPRRYARRHWRGYYRTAYWEPFPIYWPHYYHHRIHWGRIPWMFRF